MEATNTMTCPAGTSIEEACEEAIRRAVWGHTTVKLIFNDTALVIHPTDSVQLAVTHWWANRKAQG